MIGFVDPHMVVVKRISFSAFPSAQNESWKKKKKNHEKKPWKKERKKSKINIIFSHVNHTLLILNACIGPQALRHTHYTLGNFIFFQMWRRVQLRFNLLQIGA
jgi:hypothetical protein